jgi:hypothetical protein
LPDGSGNFFGTAESGGGGGVGTVFRLGPAPLAHTYVSNVGVDAGPCSRSAPCRRFDYALTKTAPGGIITAVNAGDFGRVNITQAVTISGEGTQAEIQVLASHGPNTAITVAAGPYDVVVLRHLALMGDSSFQITGVRYNSGSSLVVDDCAVSGFTGAGLDLESNGMGTATVRSTTITNCATGVQMGGDRPGPASVSLRGLSVHGGQSGIVNNSGITDVQDSQITRSAQFGLVVNAGSVSASDCTISGNGVAVQSAPGATVRLHDNNIWNNITALNTSGGVVATTGNNRRAGNATATTPLAASDQPNRGIAVQ